MFNYSSKPNLEIKDLDNVGKVKDLPSKQDLNNVQEIPAVKVSNDADVFTANKLYGNNTTPEDINRIGSSASMFTSPILNPNQTSNTNSNMVNNGFSNISASGQRTDIQPTATVSALKGVTDNNYSQILQNMYDKYLNS